MVAYNGCEDWPHDCAYWPSVVLASIFDRRQTGNLSALSLVKSHERAQGLFTKAQHLMSKAIVQMGVSVSQSGAAEILRILNDVHKHACFRLSKRPEHVGLHTSGLQPDKVFYWSKILHSCQCR